MDIRPKRVCVEFNFGNADIISTFSHDLMGTMEFVRPDLHDDLVKAADALMRAGNRVADNAEVGHYSMVDQSAWDAATIAYRKARGKTQ